MPGYNSQRRGTARTSKFFFIVMCVLFSVFCVLFVCKCVLYYCHRVSTQLQLNNNNNNNNNKFPRFYRRFAEPLACLLGAPEFPETDFKNNVLRQHLTKTGKLGNYFSVIAIFQPNCTSKEGHERKHFLLFQCSALYVSCKKVQIS
jgi:hypothetical protein